MNLSSLAPVSVAFVVALSGCSDPQAASNENFGKAINAFFEAHPACLLATRKELPLKIEQDGYPWNVDARKHLDALAKVGLLTATDTQGTTGTGLFKANHRYRQYALSDQGQKLYTTWGKGNKGFCYGKPEVVEVTNFTDPSPFMGATVSQVSYTFRVKDAAAWSQDPAVKAAYGAAVVPSGEAVKAKAMVVKTGTGWVHEGMLDKS